ncbi:putative septum-promoting GTP-binding protein 1 [Iris pallida]|uniref:Septum-promoting GTP-binding protein 1 n=1 Tax=Iris pallida TaxID=29817 RepID=A0AAX6DGT8_IRIPA|nr:putative septum-promoting GTP-binding protein 1 [Iris pallida]KAJ6793379.1 putative septum-promoting GTP-binding protein 1 [Iris pallida]
MTRLGCALARADDARWRHVARLAFARKVVRVIWRHVLACSVAPSVRGDPSPVRYHRLAHPSSSPSDRPGTRQETSLPGGDTDRVCADSDLVALKISLLGDCQIGKTSFMYKYVGDGEEEKGLQMTGLNLMDKVLSVRGGAQIVFSIWDVAGDHQYLGHVPLACKDAAAILIMFDLTSRSTLNNAIRWYRRARKWNKTGIPILIGAKFDDFVQLPLDMQWTVVNEARAYARAMNATLFFSSATHNINVNKVFKFITAKLFNLPWTVERNLTIGEPIIDF